MSLAYNSYITFEPVQDVNFIKVGSFDDGDAPTFTEAKSAREQLSGEDILLTHYQDLAVNAKYFPPTDTGNNTMTTYTVFRKTPEQNYYDYVYTLKDGKYIIKDYNIKSDHYYHYLMSIEDQQINSKTGEKVISYTMYENADEDANLNYVRVKLQNWTICDIEETTEENVYTKTGNIWKLGLNIEGESITQNLNVTTQDTLGRFPKVSFGNKRYDSMTFSGLLGNMYEYTDYSFTGESNVESQPGNTIYIYTERQDTANSEGVFGIYNKYSTENQKLEAWTEFITDGSLKLLKDTKGNAWIVQISDSASYDIDLQSNWKQTKITFSWVQVKDLSSVSIVTEE